MGEMQVAMARPTDCTTWCHMKSAEMFNYCSQGSLVEKEKEKSKNHWTGETTPYYDMWAIDEH